MNEKRRNWFFVISSVESHPFLTQFLASCYINDLYLIHSYKQDSFNSIRFANLLAQVLDGNELIYIRCFEFTDKYDNISLKYFFYFPLIFIIIVYDYRIFTKEIEPNKQFLDDNAFLRNCAAKMLSR